MQGYMLALELDQSYWGTLEQVHNPYVILELVSSTVIFWTAGLQAH
jgi:hypothetical protein